MTLAADNAYKENVRKISDTSEVPIGANNVPFFADAIICGGAI